MATLPYPYPFDPTGTKPTNLVTGEQQILTPANYRDFHFVVPTLAPFFEDGLVVKFRDLSGTVSTLVDGIDYYCTHWFISASRACAKNVYGSISFLNLNLQGTVILDYQTLGGMWTQDSATIAEILADYLHNPRITAWDEVVDMPVTFPVIDHQWDLADMVGETELVAAIADIETALRQTGSTGITAHIQDTSNPHHTTAAQVGLGNVQNYGIADSATTIAGQSAVAYVTPFGLKAALDAGPTAAINAHVALNNNPHAVTAAQTGAYTQTQTNSLLAAKLDSSGVAYDTSRFDGKTPTEYRDWALLGTAANSVLFNGLTPGQFTAAVLAGQATDAAHFGGQSPAQFTAAVLAGQANDAAHFGGYTPAQYSAIVLSGTATDSTKFNGLTAAQWQAQLGQQFGSVGNVAKQASQASTTGDAVGSYWIELGRAFFAGANPLSGQQDIHWLVAGGGSNGARLSAMRYLHLSTRKATGDGVQTVLHNFDGTTDGLTLGYTVGLVDDGTGTSTMVQACRVYAKMAQEHGTITVTELAQGKSMIYGGSTVLNVEPAGIAYLTEAVQGYASAVDLAQLRTDVTNALDSLTTAFNNLTTQVAAS